MPRLTNMTTSINSLSEAIAAAALSTTASTTAVAATSSLALDQLQPPTNASRSLSSNSSLNSSSVKSIANDGTFTEKKRKSLSSSRQKKFHRRFKQVEMDEEVINCT